MRCGGPTLEEHLAPSLFEAKLTRWGGASSPVETVRNSWDLSADCSALRSDVTEGATISSLIAVAPGSSESQAPFVQLRSELSVFEPSPEVLDQHQVGA